MSQENVEIVRRLYEWMAAGETDRAFEVYAREIEWDGAVGVVDVAGEAMTTCQSSHATDEIAHPEGR